MIEKSAPAQVLAEVIKVGGVDPNFIASHIGKTHGDNSNATSRSPAHGVLRSTVPSPIARSRRARATVWSRSAWL